MVRREKSCVIAVGPLRGLTGFPRRPRWIYGRYTSERREASRGKWGKDKKEKEGEGEKGKLCHGFWVDAPN